MTPESTQQQVTDAARHLSWWQFFLGTTGGALVVRFCLSVLRRFGQSDGISATEQKLREELVRELEAERQRAAQRETLHDEAMRAKDVRMEEMREALTEASLANIEKDRMIANLEMQLGRRGRTPQK